MAFLRECGCELAKVIIETDQEPAILAIVDNLVKLRVDKGSEETIPENSPTYSHQSNGVIERGVQSVEGFTRSLRSALEERIDDKLEIGDAIWPWLVEWVGWMMSRAEVGKDGKTGYERSKGRKARLPGMEFGEGVLWKRRREGGPLGKLSCMWDDGIYLGVKGTTGEMIIGNKEGVWRTRTVRRKTMQERWTRENLNLVGGVPWQIGEKEGEDLKSEVTVMDKE